MRKLRLLEDPVLRGRGAGRECLGLELDWVDLGDGGAGTRGRTLHYAVMSDVTRWTRDRALRRLIGCAPRASDCNSHWPRSVPRREAPNRRTPPRNHRLRTAGFGRGPQAPKAHRTTTPTSTPQCPPANPVERRSPAAAPSGCGDPPPSFEFSGRLRAATGVFP